MGREGFGEALRRLRLRAGLSVREVARRATCGKSYVSDLEHGRRCAPSMPVVQALDQAVHAHGELVLRAGGSVANLANDACTAGSDALGKDADEVRRRGFVGLTGAALFDAVLGACDDPARAGGAIDALAGVLVDHSPSSDSPVDLPSLDHAVGAAKRNYQACRYFQVINGLPVLLRDLRVACTVLEGDARLRAYALSAEAYHAAASVLLKQEDKGLAWLAADRSVRMARASQNPLVIGSSARIITHALMDGGHHRTAADVARKAALRMDAALADPSPDDLSVYGTLLLRGAIAAAHSGERHVTAELLDEAADAGARLGHDGNHMWTAFGPNNVLCHRVHIAVRLGDAGTAIEYARRVEIGNLPADERRASLLLDTSRAFLMRGQHESALHSLRAAGELAPQEVVGRGAPLRLAGDILAGAPPGLRREAREYAASLGARA
ncbi:helix-turn-helix transcriptional regulator [Nonomuraea sp. PA05]|uniref:helix-turn-helix domain-containing protein n=1 Tax=Nonomuraea sp. PA05 TaxID=2604466 RepID=UPI0011D4D380|nr:helix-turn-helix transcriptional regulator [Nonomuraea sp. PA05]TYB61394.1 helix-turn-helix transcriptional regulator [Nonomuraea sp. PA05]